MVEIWAKNNIHSNLERRKGVAQVNGHHLKFIVAMVSVKHIFVDIILMHLNLMATL